MYNMCPDKGACNDMCVSHKTHPFNPLNYNPFSLIFPRWVLQIAGQNSCPDSCNGKGKCILAKCVCDERFWGPSCALLQCPQSFCYFDYTIRRQICTHCCGGAHDCPGSSSSDPNPRGECIGTSLWLGATSSVPTGKCECKDGWSGENCGQIACPCAESFKNVDGICKVGV